MTGRYDFRFVAVSIVIAVVAAYAALALADRISNPRRRASLFWLTGGLLALGCGMLAMHYVTLGLATIALAALVLLSLGLAAFDADRRTTQQAGVLARSQRELDSVFDAMTEALLVLDASGTAVRMNRAAQEMFELPPPPITEEDLLRIFDLLASDGTPLPAELHPTSVGARGEVKQNYEITFRRKDTGKIIFTEANIVPIAGSSGDILCTYRDISERRQLDSTRNIVAAIVESSEDAIIGKDLDGVVTSWNKGAEKVFGYASEEMIGKSIKILIPEDRKSEEDSILAKIRRGEIVDHIETVRVRKDGQIINISLTISPIRDGWGNIVGASKIARDISAIKVLERQLRQSQKMDAIGQLTGGIAHDFNNLLGIIIGNVELAQTLIPDNDLASKRLETTLKAAGRGADLTRRLLAFSSIDELRPAPNDLAHSIRNMLELSARVIGPDIRVVTEFRSEIPPVMVDAAGLETALLNLVVNSRDAMPNGGVLTIRVHLSDLADTYPPVKAGDLAPGCYACISVSDTGCGMAKEVIERAFEPFFTTKGMAKGTGLDWPWSMDLHVNREERREFTVRSIEAPPFLCTCR